MTAQEDRRTIRDIGMEVDAMTDLEERLRMSCEQPASLVLTSSQTRHKPMSSPLRLSP